MIHGMDRITFVNEARERTKVRKIINKISTPAVKYFHTAGNIKFRFPDKAKHKDANEKIKYSGTKNGQHKTEAAKKTPDITY